MFMFRTEKYENVLHTQVKWFNIELKTMPTENVRELSLCTAEIASTHLDITKRQRPLSILFLISFSTYGLTIAVDWNESLSPVNYRCLSITNSNQSIHVTQTEVQYTAIDAFICRGHSLCSCANRRNLVFFRTRNQRLRNHNRRQFSAEFIFQV